MFEKISVYNQMNYLNKSDKKHKMMNLMSSLTEKEPEITSKKGKDTHSVLSIFLKCFFGSLFFGVYQGKLVCSLCVSCISSTFFTTVQSMSVSFLLHIIFPLCHTE